ncbi:hypothetical protein R3P38DRAFT_2807898 [Favolaschia claudopus]|uniref:Uncharacterized protein n=1 Tax=Favolaschia claudopus TaxID=2862362 RepID=A0AAV9ZI60_9AGAR
MLRCRWNATEFDFACLTFADSNPINLVLQAQDRVLDWSSKGTKESIYPLVAAIWEIEFGDWSGIEQPGPQTAPPASGDERSQSCHGFLTQAAVSAARVAAPLNLKTSAGERPAASASPGWELSMSSSMDLSKSLDTPGYLPPFGLIKSTPVDFISDISIVIRFGAVDSLEHLKQEMGRAGRDPQIFAQAHFLVEKSCFQAQKKSTRKKQKTTNAAAIDGGEPRDRPEANDAPAESIEFPVLLDDDKLPDNLQWRKKLNPGVRHYAAAQHPDCRRDVSDEYFGNPVRERVLANALCCDLCANDGPFPPKAPETHPTTPPTHPQSAASSTATTPNNNGKRGRRAAASDTDAGAKRRGGHLTECKEIVERWATAHAR